MGAGGMDDMAWELRAVMGSFVGRARVLTSYPRNACVMTLLVVGLWTAGSLSAQGSAGRVDGASKVGDADSDIVGASGVFAIPAVNDPSLPLTFTIEDDIADGLTASGRHQSPLITVSVAQPRPPEVTVVGEVRVPGIYALSSATSLIDALVVAGGTLPSAGAEAVIVPAGHEGVVVLSSAEIERDSERAARPDDAAIRRVRFDEPDSDAQSARLTLHDGDTVFVLPASKVYVLGQVTRPGGYVMGLETRTVLDGPALAGGASELAATSRIEIIRIVDGHSKRIRVDVSAILLPENTIVVPQRRF